MSTAATIATIVQTTESRASQLNLEELERLASHDLLRFVRQAYRQLGNAHDAEDAVQDAFLAAYKNLSRFRGEARLSTWFTTIVTNAARMKRRGHRPLVSLDEAIDSTQEGISTPLDICRDHRPGAEEIYARAELQNRLNNAVNDLSPRYRRAVRLYYFDGMTASEVSEKLGISVGTIKAQLARARVKLAKLLRKDLSGPALAR